MMTDKDSKLLIDRYPKIAKQWNFLKNKDINIKNIKYGTKTKVWWTCPKCKSDYESAVQNRTIGGTACPYCRGLKVNHTNSLFSVEPVISRMWHPTKNGKLTPHEVTKAYGNKVWWLGACGHEWDARTKDLINGSGCPFCSNKRILTGFNDLHTTHPHIAKMLYNLEDGYKYTHGSSKKVMFKCLSCNEKIGEKHIRNVISKGLGCSICKNTSSLAERIMISILKQLKIENTTEKGFNWSENRRYDFYVSSMNLIIEMHGEQHYKNSYKNGRCLQDEQMNDFLKESLAKENGIDKYIIIDCERSDFNYIRKNIESSFLVSLMDINQINWEQVFIDSNTPTIMSICHIYNNEEVTQKEIAERLGVSTATVIRTLSTASTIGLCDYKANSKRNKSLSIKHMEKPVVQLSMDGEYISEFDSLAQAARSLGKKQTSSFSACCKGRLKSSAGFKWMYKVDYEELNKAI